PALRDVGCLARLGNERDRHNALAERTLVLAAEVDGALLAGRAVAVRQPSAKGRERVLAGVGAAGMVLAAERFALMGHDGSPFAAAAALRIASSIVSPVPYR